MSHTPGPWIAQDAETERGIPVTNEDGSVLVAWVEPPADARLIAAAPDLLAALETWWDRVISGLVTDAEVEQARAAIAKAKGES